MKNGFLRPRRSVSHPKKIAPSTAPARYTLLASPTSVLENCSIGLCFRAPDIAPASVTSRPSRIQVIPRAATTRVWKRPHGRRSSRAGISLSTIAPTDCALCFILHSAACTPAPHARWNQRATIHWSLDWPKGLKSGDGIGDGPPLRHQHCDESLYAVRSSNSDSNAEPRSTCSPARCQSALPAR